MYAYNNLLLAVTYLALISCVNGAYERSFRGRWKVAQSINQRKVDQILSQYTLDPTHIDEFKQKLFSNFMSFQFGNYNEVLKTDLTGLLEHKGGVWEYSPSWMSYIKNDTNKPIGILKFENYYKTVHNGKFLHFAIYYQIDIYKGKYNFGGGSAVPSRLGGQVWLSMHPIWPTMQFRIGTFTLEPDVGRLLYDQATGPLSEHLKRRHRSKEI